MDSVRSRINRWNPRHLQIYRQFLSDVEIVYPDSSGRILIPKRLLEAAGLSQGIRFIGMGDYIEVWSSAATSQPFVAQDEFTASDGTLMSDPSDRRANEQWRTDMSDATYHIPVLLAESVDGLAIRPSGTYVDVTFGGGGHSREILRRLGPTGRLFGFDQDGDSERNIPEGEHRLTFIRSNFRYLSNWMRFYEIDHIDGLLADLGVSSHHFDDESRGFSFRFDSPLDMRMNKSARLTAADVVNEYSEQRLADILYLYGELKNARRLAAVLVKARSAAPIQTTQQLAGIVAKLFPREREKKEVTKVFQALRIEVNHEMSALQEMLLAATSLLSPGGRLSVITYHSLEDRIVKNIMKSGNAGGQVEQDFFGRTDTPLRAMSNKVVTPSAEEQASNPRSRSAKLRIAEKK